MLQQIGGQRVWDLVAPAQGISDRLTAPVHRLALEHLRPRPGEAVLDIGCGAGAALPLLREAVGATGRVVGVDRSPAMLTRARRRCARWPDIELRRADVSRDPLGDNEFDAAMAVSCFSATPDVAASVRNACAALRPGGRLFVFDLRLVPAGPGWVRAATVALRVAYRALAGFTGADVVPEIRATFTEVRDVLPRNRTGAVIAVVRAEKAAVAP